MIDPSTTLKKLRTDAKNARRSMTPSDRSRASTRIANRFLNSRYFLGSKTIGCYVSTRDEVDTSEIIERAWRAKKRIFLPVTAANGHMFFRETRPETGLARNEFGLWEPVSGERIDASRLDVVVTPLVAFDDQGNRIGMGGGYFDRTFAFLAERNCWLHPKLIGVAFDCQRVPKIPRNPWDIPVFRVLTETGGAVQ
jgi:5-formyltetrahydrofolate cyclo-ligase